MVREATKSVYQLIKFATIQPGSFMQGYVKGERSGMEIEIKKPFGIQVTHVTQYQWAKVMGENPSHFKKGEHSIQVVVNGKSIELQPDHPVEQVSFEDVQKFIQKLNLLVKSKDPLIKELIPDHRDGDVYDLPTNEQWEFVARNRGRDSDAYFFGSEEFKLREYAWYHENSGGRPHSVGQLKPLIVDGQEIWDIIGNVWQWVKSDRDKSQPGRTVRGGGWNDLAQFCRSGERGTYHVRMFRFSFVGFRLVRIRGQTK
jgi:formylglycine-generating enzyme required for sulfatase activity